MSLITIVLLCHNRPIYAMNAIKSILSQSEKDFRFVVSDNSTNRELRDIMKAHFSKVEYKSWFPGVPFLEHFKRVILLVDTPYFVMFHDDDSMEPNYVSRVLEEFKRMPSAAAVGTNACLIDGSGDKIQNQTIYTGPEKIKIIKCKKTLLRQYLSCDFGGVMPFCSYAYNSEMIKGVLPNVSMKDYFDTYFIMEVVDRGPLVWITEPLVGSRRHKDNRGHTSGVGAYKPLLNIAQDMLGPIIKQIHLDEYRFLRLFFALKERNKLPLPALKYLVSALPRLMVSSHSFRKRILKKIYAKIAR
jgi:glycosyltransferase involved in cell wall biosynthesis